MDCGPTCLRMIAKFYGKSYSLQALRDKCHITREGVSMLGISNAAESIGFRTTGVKLTWNQLKEEMMGGKINVQSQFGKGSLFVVSIPQKISKMTDPNQAIELNLTSKMPVINDIEIEDKPVVEMPQPIQQSIEQPVQASNNTSSYSNKKILIVDDSKINIKVARKALQDFNFEIDECYDGQECLDKLPNGNEYDLILMDIMMPNMSGETAIAKLKEKPNFNIPTIALTADAVAGAREKYLSEGFIDYIAKPFNG